MDWSLVLGIFGILVSIAVGWLTYRLANKRAFSQRYTTAKATVLQELSKSLGEDAVPTPDILQATIRSVLRETGDPKLRLDVDDVLDDLVRQVTSDPFLDSERRRKLQSDIQKVRVDAEKEQTRDASSVLEFTRFGYLRSSTLPVVIGLFTALISLVVLVAPFATKSEGDLPSLLKNLKEHPFGLVAGFLVVLLVPILIIFFEEWALPFRHWRRKRDD